MTALKIFHCFCENCQTFHVKNDSVTITKQVSFGFVFTQLLMLLSYFAFFLRFNFSCSCLFSHFFQMFLPFILHLFQICFHCFAIFALPAFEQDFHLPAFGQDFICLQLDRTSICLHTDRACICLHLDRTSICLHMGRACMYTYLFV